MSFAGRGILITRPRERAAALAAAVEAAGARAVLFPAIEIRRLARPAALERLDGFDWIFFVSPSAVEASLGAGVVLPRTARVAAVGPGTRAMLGRHGVQEVAAPEEGADSEHLLALPVLADLSGQRALIVRGVGGRALLGEALAARGAAVAVAECYRRERPAADAGPLLAAWRQGGVAAVTVTSAEALENLRAMLGDAGSALLRATPLFAGHERIATRARDFGIERVVVAGPRDRDMLARLVAYFSP